MEEKESGAASPSFEFRSLGEEELEVWFDHLAFVFTQTPRNYFVSHWYNDPWRTVDGIFVAVDKNARDNKVVIASTVRVYCRKVYVRGTTFSMGGIGEVSTKPQYRSMGLASALLQKASTWMQHTGMVLGSLHTSNAIPFYKSLGWQSVPTVVHVYPLRRYILPHHHENSQEKAKVFFQRLFFKPQKRHEEKENKEEDEDEENIWKQIQQIYRKYSGTHFNGTFDRDNEEREDQQQRIRSGNYWQQWVRYELQQHRKAKMSATFVIVEEAEADHPQKIVQAYMTAYLPLKEENAAEKSLYVQEFGAREEEFVKDGGRDAFVALLKVISQALLEEETEKEEAERIKLVVPAAVEKHFRNMEDEEGGTEREIRRDEGMMMKVVCDEQTCRTRMLEMGRQEKADEAVTAKDLCEWMNHELPFLAWRTDAF
ncbi:putative acetyltransferase [Balamuthia mandrillaris]